MIPIAIACIVALGYQLTALYAVLRHRNRRDPQPTRFPPISILKPVHGVDPQFLEAIRSHAAQDYPQFEILFGASDPEDPAIDSIRALQQEFPHRDIRFFPCALAPADAPNAKVGVLIELAAHARHDILLVNDSDIHVPPGYLASVVAPLEDPATGVVTCLYRPAATAIPAIWEALGIATEFVPSILVAPLAGVKEFGLGSTLVFRRQDLDAIGGFQSIAAYIADDYQLAKRITQLGRRVHLSKTVVETTLGDGATWSGVWNHQLRWARTIRVSRGAYAGLPVTFATLWALAALATPGLALLGGLTLAARFAVAIAAGWGILGSRLVLFCAPFIPLRDLWGVAIWAAGLFGSKVRWRDRSIKLRRDGKIASSRVSKTVDLRR